MNFLDLPFEEKDNAKNLGARWEPDARRWYVPNGIPMEAFARWLPSASVTLIEQSTDQPAAKGVGLALFLRSAAGALKKAAPGEHWIRAEISQYKVLNGGHLSIELAEHDEQGKLVARIQCFIWTANAGRIVSRFSAGTGGELAAGIKVMVRASIDLHLTGSTRLIISDIDPSYTLGDIEANLQKIRQALTTEGIFSANKQLPAPTEFFKVAIISPNAAAGLGDFKRDADHLAAHRLCQFDYFSALFQGPGAVVSLLAAMTEVQERHVQVTYDAICIIRGGGAATDLYYLNDLSVARALCLLPAPVFTGIGHERDNTILDEVANTRFDTPSKVIGHISSAIQANAVAAEKAFQALLLHANRILAAADKELELTFSAIRQGIANDLHTIDSEAEHLFASTHQSVASILQAMAAETEHLFASIQPAGAVWLHNAEQAIEQRFEFILMRGEADITLSLAEVERYFDAIAVSAQHRLATIDHAADELMTAIQQQAHQQLVLATQAVEGLGREILGMGPRATLRRGFTITRSGGRPLVSAEDARQSGNLTVQFRDGVVKVVAVVTE